MVIQLFVLVEIIKPQLMWKRLKNFTLGAR